MATISCSYHFGKSDLLCLFSNFGMSGSCHTSPSVLNRLSWYNVSPHECTEYVWSQATHSHRSIGLLAEVEGSVVYCSLYWASLCGTLAHQIHLCNLACHHIWCQKKNILKIKSTTESVLVLMPFILTVCPCPHSCHHCRWTAALSRRRSSTWLCMIRHTAWNHY